MPFRLLRRVEAGKKAKWLINCCAEINCDFTVTTNA
ncbi:predicted protein [Brucella abortus]|uniref:Uncharacterized protein n=2 Tax=Brucella abortus TaxID=235 RepID=Q2YRB3_BRUA2|nr:hypothetical protein BruAb1_1594 [Brucella abortus bv. 1 str. 9-941]CAJ11578.1 conserved hypothetical protein [Brucella abortus 2308]SHO31384.1 predicted protein [Brucella abortus]